MDSAALRISEYRAILSKMDVTEAGRLGAIKTNQILTTETRRKAAKKGWKRHKTLKKSLK